MSNYQFADLLRIFYALRLETLKINNYHDFANACGVSRRTIINWFDNRKPRTAKQVITIAVALGLMPEQTDLLLFSINPSWVRYGTPTDVLKSFQLLRPREYPAFYPFNDQLIAPSIIEIEQTWLTYFEDRFESNFNRWGLGFRDDGISVIEKSIKSNILELKLTNNFYHTVFVGADSNCFAPPVYYFSISAKITDGYAKNSGYILIFDELSDNRHSIFRIREPKKQISVVSTDHGKTDFAIHLQRLSAPSIQQQQWNKLAILAIRGNHWFYINDHCVGRCSLPRYESARLDVGMVAGEPGSVTAQFQRMIVRVPPLQTK